MCQSKKRPSKSANSRMGSTPFERAHVDYAGPSNGICFLILMGAYSKWPKLKIISDMSKDTTMDKMREIFATFGLPSLVVTEALNPCQINSAMPKI